jgi:hypothetical protein
MIVSSIPFIQSFSNLQSLSARNLSKDLGSCERMSDGVSIPLMCVNIGNLFGEVYN